MKQLTRMAALLGAVALTTIGSSQAAIVKAVEDARGVNGVKTVKNDMRLK